MMKLCKCGICEADCEYHRPIVHLRGASWPRCKCVSCQPSIRDALERAITKLERDGIYPSVG